MRIFKRKGNTDIQGDIQNTEVLIQRSKQKFNERVDSDIHKLEKINRALSNGVSISVSH